MRKFTPAIFVLLGFYSWSCGLLQTVAVNSTTGIVDNGLGAIFEESDLTLAEQSIPANITLLEALYRSKDKDDDHLALLLTQACIGLRSRFCRGQGSGPRESSLHPGSRLRIVGVEKE